ncbi:hypothetical protein GGX14DRAFT_431753 [Mycena pura]|uniref:Enoyl reductase (ER) domain-containing protein n=1 Tax=Mycena pura TaxID=153505 RepID=A0AAD6VSR4_9AGAR|nr:hypothetical protein GGX14DRAFT_431753 [Mycena pura]
MAPEPNPRVLYAKIPSSQHLIPGEHLVYDPAPTIDLECPLAKGQFLTKTLLLSPEPYMRERLRDPAINTYSTPMKVGQPLVGMALVIVLRSEKEGLRAGEYMVGFTPWEAYTVQPYVDARVEYKDFPSYTFDMDSLILKPVQDPQGAFPWPRFCSCLGVPGMAAYVGIEKIADVKPGQTIYVSSGASGVGSMVIQFCKQKGLKVIASASTDEKVKFMKSLGADVPFNYKTTPVAEVLAREGPIDRYFDNVGGEQFEAAVNNMSLNGVVVICGAISELNIPREQRYGNISTLFHRRIRVQGFLVTDSPDLLGRFFQEIPVLLAQGKLKSEEHLFWGMENGIAAFLSLFDGTAQAKPVVVLDPKYGASA